MKWVCGEVFTILLCNSFIHYMTPFSHSNKNRECAQRGISGKWDGEGYSSCNEVQSNVALSRMVVI